MRSRAASRRAMHRDRRRTAAAAALNSCVVKLPPVCRRRSSASIAAVRSRPRPSSMACAISGPLSHSTLSASSASCVGSRSAREAPRARSQTEGVRVLLKYTVPLMEPPPVIMLVAASAISELRAWLLANAKGEKKPLRRSVNNCTASSCSTKSRAIAPSPRAPVWKPMRLRTAPCSGLPPVTSFWKKRSSTSSFAAPTPPSRSSASSSSKSSNGLSNRAVGQPVSRSITKPGAACTESMRQPPP